MTQIEINKYKEQGFVAIFLSAILMTFLLSYNFQLSQKLWEQAETYIH